MMAYIHTESPYYHISCYGDHTKAYFNADSFKEEEEKPIYVKNIVFTNYLRVTSYN